MSRRKRVFVEARAYSIIPVEPSTVFEYTTNHRNYSEFLRPVWPIPGITGATIDGSGVAESGATRRVETTDGARFVETIDVHQQNVRHSYRWIGGPKPPFSLLIRAGAATWEYYSVDGGTRVDWTYRFELTSRYVIPLAWVVAAGPFRRWMGTGLRNAAKVLSGEPVYSPPEHQSELVV